MKKSNLKMCMGALVIMGSLIMASCKDITTGSETGAEGTDNAEYHTGTPAGSDNSGGGDEMRTDAQGAARTGNDTVTTTTNNGNSTAEGSGMDNTDSRNGRE